MSTQFGNIKPSHWWGLGFAVSIYLAFFLYYYPCTHGIDDEVGFINQALVWSKGSTSIEGAGLSVFRDTMEHNGKHIFWRNPGRSIVILPFILIGGIQSVFLSGALIHILLTIVTGLILARLAISPLYAVLVLCHPTLALYSRTVMGDAPAALCIMLAVLALLYTRHPGKWIGFAIACAAVSRYQLGILLPIVSLVLWKDRNLERPKREAVACLIAGGVIGGLIVAYNLWLYGHPVGLVRVYSFDISFVPGNTAFYLTSFLLIWPGMLLLVACDSSRIRWYSWSLSLPVFLLLLPYYYYDKGTSFAQTLILGQRLLQPIIPLLTISYVFVLVKKLWPKLQAYVPERLPAAAAVATCLVLLLAQLFMFHQHQNRLLQYKTAREWVSTQIPANSLIISNNNLFKLLAVPAPGIPNYRLQESDFFGYQFDYSKLIEAEKKPWYLAYFSKNGSNEIPAYIRDYQAKYQLVRIDSGAQGVILYKSLNAS
ncbi:MAG TPA: hypothetical protein VFZ34_18275 [Blastocatellia bacterium]|nr:hypothetical protein [Blastocatellia bacterium]